ncbi:MAG: hypothetical protein ACYDAB_02110 [bacterium]
MLFELWIVLHWVFAMIQQIVTLVCGSILTAYLSLYHYVKREAAPRRVVNVILISWFLLASLYAWREDKISLLQTQAKLAQQGEIGLVRPWLRNAFSLENYEHSSDRGDNRDREIGLTPATLTLREMGWLRFADFDWGVCNGNKTARIENVQEVVYILGDGKDALSDKGEVQVEHRNWVPFLSNYKYVYEFSFGINPQSCQNADGVLRLKFPRHGYYTIRIVITAKDLGKSPNYDLPVYLW